MKKTSTKKIVSLVTAAMMLTGMFAGCGKTGANSGDNSNPSNNSSSSDKPSTSSISLSVENVNLEKAANTSIALTAADLGISVSEGATLSYEVVKKQGVGSATENLNVTDSFIVEAGYFYDIIVTATKGSETATQFVQVRDQDLEVFSFEAAGEEIPIIGTGVVQWHKMTDENGNSMMKMYRPTIEGSDNGNVPMVLDKLFTAAGIDFEETEKVYDIYADIAYDKPLDNDQSWGVQLKRDYDNNDDDEYLTKASGRYLVGQAAWNESKYRIETNFWARTKKDSEYAIDGTNNFMKWDNVVIVEGEKKVVEETPPEKVEKPEVVDTFAIANKIHNKTAGEKFSINAETLGYTAPAGGTIAYEVTKVVGAGTDKEVIIAFGDQFTVEAGYFYDIKVTATDAQGKVSVGYAQLRDSALKVFDFSAENEIIPIIGSGVVQWHKMELNGNSMMKMYRPVHVSGNQVGGAPVVFGGSGVGNVGLLDVSGMDMGASTKYKVYADITYYVLTDGNTQWAVQLTGANPSGGWVTKITGRYYLGEASFNEAAQRFELTCIVRTLVDSNGNATSFAIDGENNYVMWDNVVLEKA